MASDGFPNDFTPGQAAIVENMIVRVVSAAGDRFKDEVKRAVREGINEHRLACEARKELESLREIKADKQHVDTVDQRLGVLEGVRNTAQGGLSMLTKVFVALAGIGGFVGAVAGIVAALRH